jgi:hypothetical protein
MAGVLCCNDEGEGDRRSPLQHALSAHSKMKLKPFLKMLILILQL